MCNSPCCPCKNPQARPKLHYFTDSVPQSLSGRKFSFSASQSSNIDNQSIKHSARKESKRVNVHEYWTVSLQVTTLHQAHTCGLIVCLFTQGSGVCCGEPEPVRGSNEPKKHTIKNRFQPVTNPVVPAQVNYLPANSKSH